jgi:hypothetical protein
MMEYTVLSASTAKELIEKVNAHIRAGWRPQGGVAIDTSYKEYAQAMVSG